MSTPPNHIQQFYCDLLAIHDPKGRVAKTAATIAEYLQQDMTTIAAAYHDICAQADIDIVAMNHIVAMRYSSLHSMDWVAQLMQLMRQMIDRNITFVHIAAAASTAMQLCQRRIVELLSQHPDRNRASIADIDIEKMSVLLENCTAIFAIEMSVISFCHARASSHAYRAQQADNSQHFTDIVALKITHIAQHGGQLREQADLARVMVEAVGERIDSVVKTAQESAQVMRQAALAVRDLIHAVDYAWVQIDESATLANHASEQATQALAQSEALIDHSVAIEPILSLVRDIAGQSNILAINATIEAVRAGDVGRGFAALAQEIKNMASQTARTADDMSDKIIAIHKATHTTHKANHATRAIVSDVQKSTQTIRDGIGAQQQTIAQIANALKASALKEGATTPDSLSMTIAAIHADTEAMRRMIEVIASQQAGMGDDMAQLQDSSHQFVESLRRA